MARMKKCPVCQKDVSTTAPLCPNCGHRLKRSHGCLITLLIFVIMIAISIAVAVNMNNEIQKEISGTSETTEYITLEEYNSIETGMSYAAVQEIVGSAGTISSQVESNGIKIIIVTWYGDGIAGSNANVTFTNDAVSAKAQVGLK